jgi:hypothetical protein
LKRETAGVSESYTLQTGTVTLFLSWVYFTTILGLIPSVGIYILMVDTIASNIFKVLKKKKIKFYSYIRKFRKE